MHKKYKKKIIKRFVQKTRLLAVMMMRMRPTWWNDSFLGSFHLVSIPWRELTVAFFVCDQKWKTCWGNTKSRSITNRWKPSNSRTEYWVREIDSEMMMTMMDDDETRYAKCMKRSYDCGRIDWLPTDPFRMYVCVRGSVCMFLETCLNFVVES